ncbi:MAG: hypothetical protein CMJ49_13715 [Planctomycetaceae bacterium]|nr:hypothetical protein [Planctomycetaceae bacterium]
MNTQLPDDQQPTSRWLFTRLFRCFRMAIQPGKLFLALILVLLVFLGGLLLDGLWGPQVLGGEFHQFYLHGTRGFDQFLDTTTADTEQELKERIEIFDDSTKTDETSDIVELHDKAEGLVRRIKSDQFAAAREDHADDSEARDAAIREIKTRYATIDNELREIKPRGVFKAALDIKLSAIKRMALASINPSTWFDDINQILAPLEELLTLPLWLWHAHPGFLITYLIIFVLIWSIFGGAIHRMATVEAADGEPVGAGHALVYVKRRWIHYVLAPLIPLIIIIVIGALMALAGWIVFNIPGINILGGIAYVFALIGGFIMALLLVGWAAGLPLMYPALSAEGSESFDAVSRSFSYVFARPWRLAWYVLVAMVYGAATYMFVGLFMHLVSYMAQAAVALGAADVDLMLGERKFGDLLLHPDDAELEGTAYLAAIFVFVWMQLFLLLIAAYAVSFFASAASTIYLLLRQHCDGTDVAEIHFDAPDPDDVAGSAEEKVEPETTPTSTAESSTDSVPPPDSLDSADDR